MGKFTLSAIYSLKSPEFGYKTRSSGSKFQVGTYCVQQNCFWVKKCSGSDPGAYTVVPPEKWSIQKFGFFDFGQNWSSKVNLSNAKYLRSFAQKLAELEQFLFGPLDFSEILDFQRKPL